MTTTQIAIAYFNVSKANVSAVRAAIIDPMDTPKGSVFLAPWRVGMNDSVYQESSLEELGRVRLPFAFDPTWRTSAIRHEVINVEVVNFEDGEIPNAMGWLYVPTNFAEVTVKTWETHHDKNLLRGDWGLIVDSGDMPKGTYFIMDDMACPVQVFDEAFREGRTIVGTETRKMRVQFHTHIPGTELPEGNLYWNGKPARELYEVCQHFENHHNGATSTTRETVLLSKHPKDAGYRSDCWGNDSAFGNGYTEVTYRHVSDPELVKAFGDRPVEQFERFVNGWEAHSVPKGGVEYAAWYARHGK